LSLLSKHSNFNSRRLVFIR